MDDSEVTLELEQVLFDRIVSYTPVSLYDAAEYLMYVQSELRWAQVGPEGTRPMPRLRALLREVDPPTGNFS